MEQVGFSVILEAFLCKANGELTGRLALKGDVDELWPLIWLVPSTETSGDKTCNGFSAEGWNQISQLKVL